MVTLEEITERKEDGKIFTRLPDDLDSSTLLEIIHLELPEGVVVNNIEYNPIFAKSLKDNFTPEELETLYYMSIGYDNRSIVKNMKINKRTLENHINDINGKVYFPNNMSRRVSVVMAYRKAFPHLFPMRQYKPIRLTDRQHEVAQMIAEGHTNASITKELVIEVHTVERHTNYINGRVRDQLPPGYDLRVYTANMFSSGAFYSKSHNPTGIG